MNQKALSVAILEILERGDEDDQPWSFYENTEGLHSWTYEDACWERGRFVDAVIERYQFHVARGTS